jgi:hypothetical protein
MKTGRYNFRILIVAYTLATLSGFMGCETSKDQRIRQLIDDKVDDFRKTKTLECRTNLLSEAERKVDSILLAEAQNKLRDSLTNSKPVRPAQPAQVSPIDSFEIAPIF